MAQSKGATIVDTTLQGLGRGAGNTPTEQMLLTLARTGIDLGVNINQLIDFGFEYVQPLLPEKGLNPIDIISGYSLFHSNYVSVIKKYSNKYCVDPKELIPELCKINKVDAPEALVNEVASNLTPIDENLLRYYMKNYYKD